MSMTVSEMTDDELAPQGQRHGECFWALFLMCEEMTRRGMTQSMVGDTFREAIDAAAIEAQKGKI